MSDAPFRELDEETVFVLEPEGDEMPELVDLVLEAQRERERRERADTEAREAERIHGVVIGRVTAVTDRGPIVSYARCPSPAGAVARAAARVAEADVGRAAALMFEGGDPGLPILMGLLEDEAPLAPHPAIAGLSVRDQPDKIEIKCDKAISLSCGKSTIIVTPSGKIVLRGKYVLSRSSGVNRIQGGSVRIN